MFRWHEPRCSKPYIDVVGGLPWCQTCCAVPPMNEDLDFRDDLGPPHPPSRANGQPRTLAWPASVKYDKDDAGEEDEDLRVAHIGTDLQPHNGSADRSSHSQAPLNANKPFRHKSWYPFLPPRSIRVLDIAPGGPDDLLHGNFRVVPLSMDRPHYEALSYTWADAAGNHRRCRVMYTGPFWDVLPITQNCEHALRSVRPSKNQLAQRKLWIDAVCVNQDDVIERTSQVALMPEIYSGAAEVLAYLGLATDSSDLALDAISRSLSTNDCYHSDGEAICQMCQTAIVELFKRPYFGRLWIVQEIILSKSIIIYCGDVSCSLPFSKISKLLPVDLWTVRRAKTPLDQKSDLLSLMIETGNCACKDPRDKVFALLGIPSHWPEDQILPDYSLSLDEVTIGIASYFVQVCNLEWLVFMLAGLNRTNDVHHLPSWVPDLTSFQVFGHQKYLCDTYLRSSMRQNRTLYDHDDVFVEERRVVDKAYQSLTEIPELKSILFEGWTQKKIQITSRQAHLKVAATKLCNVHEVFDLENARCSRDILYSKGASYSTTTGSKGVHNPMIEVRCSSAVLLIKQPKSAQTLREEWSHFIMKTDDLYWLHGVDGYAVLRFDPSCNAHTIVCVCDLVMDCKIGNHRQRADSLRLRPLPAETRPAVKTLKSRLSAMVASTSNTEARFASIGTDDEVVVKLAIYLANRLTDGEHHIFNQLEDLKHELELNLANSDILECVISELESTANGNWEGKGSSSASNTASGIATNPRSVAAFLWSILPHKIGILPNDIGIAPQPRETKGVVDDTDTSSVYSSLYRCADLMDRLIAGFESGEFSEHPVDYGPFPKPTASHLSMWNSSWDSFRLGTGLPEPLWDTPRGVVHMLKRYRGIAPDSWQPLFSDSQGNMRVGDVPHRPDAWSWAWMKHNHDQHQFTRIRFDDRINWIFGLGTVLNPVQEEEQIIARLYMQMCGLSWTSVVQVSIK